MERARTARQRWPVAHCSLVSGLRVRLIPVCYLGGSAVTVTTDRAHVTDHVTATTSLTLTLSQLKMRLEGQRLNKVSI